MKRYGRYKSTGIPWIGEIPEHWEVKRLKFLLQMPLQYGANEAAELNDPELPRFVRITDVDEFGNLRDDTFRSISEEVAKYYLLEEGDLLFARSGATVGKSFYYKRSWGRAAYAGYLIRARLKLDEALPAFINFVTKSGFYPQWIRSVLIQSTIQNVSAEKYSSFISPLPPLPEQNFIAEYLNHKTDQIDCLIAKKQRLIDLLNEEKTAIINHAVTKGINPDSPMKESGIPWLGEIPAHWEFKRLKFVSDLQTGLTLGKKYRNRQLVTRPYLRVANVQDGYLDLSIITEVALPPEDVDRYKLQAGDVLMTEGGDFDKLGRGYVWEDQITDCLHQNHIFAVRPKKMELDSHFLSAVLTSSHGKHYFTSTSQQTTNLATTNSTKLRNFPIPLPPLDEQSAILGQLAKVLSQLDILSAQIDNIIKLLQEFRTALISEAVTGKIDVRGAH